MASMADFRIWGKVEQIGVKQFVAIVSAVPEVEGDHPIVLIESTANLVEANARRNQLMREVGERVRAQGNRVVDVEEQ